MSSEEEYRSRLDLEKQNTLKSFDINRFNSLQNQEAIDGRMIGEPTPQFDRKDSILRQDSIFTHGR